MADAFNPYCEWLGLKDCPQPNYYQLLGLPFGESDVNKIAKASDLATTKVHGIHPGDQAAARSKLLAEIQSAKCCLLDPSNKAEYDRMLTGGSSKAAPPGSKDQPKPAPSVPARPKALPKATLLAPASPKAIPKAAPLAPAKQLPRNDGHGPDLPPGIPTTVTPDYPQPVPGYPPAGQASSWSAPQPSGSYGQHYGQPGTPSAYPSGVPVTGAPGPRADPMTPYLPPSGSPSSGAAPAFGSPYTNPAFPPSDNIQLIQQRAVSRSATALAARRKQETRNILLLGVGSVVVIVASLFVYRAMTTNNADDPESVAQNRPQSPPDGPEPGPSPTAAPQPVAPLPGTTSSLPVAPTPMPPPRPDPPLTLPMPQPMPTPPPAPTLQLIAEPPQPEAPQPIVKLTREQLMDLGKALTNAKIALGKQDFDQAAIDITRAEQLAKLSEHQATTARLKEVASYAKQFHDALAVAVQNFQVGEEIKVGGGTVVIVVATGADKIVIRIAAQNRTIRLAELPVGLALAIVDYRLSGDDPVNRVIRGAYLAIEKRQDPDNLAKAKSLWDEALSNGVEIRHLMPFLTDDYDLAKKE